MKLYDRGVYLVNGNELVQDGANAIEEVRKKTGACSFSLLKNLMLRVSYEWY